MKSSRWVVIGLVLLLGITVLQPVQAQPRGWERFYEENLDHFVQFGLENGVNLAWAHRFQETNFLRYGADFSMSDDTVDDKYMYPDTTTWRNSSSDRFSITAHVDYLKPVYPYEAVRLYLGAGPLLRFSWYDSERSIPVDPGLGLPNETYTNQNQSWRSGLRGLIGGEYALNSRLSFFAEVSVEGTFEWSKSDYTSNYLAHDGNGNASMEYMKQTTETKRWRMDMSEVRIGVTFRYGETP